MPKLTTALTYKRERFNLNFKPLNFSYDHFDKLLQAFLINSPCNTLWFLDRHLPYCKW